MSALPLAVFLQLAATCAPGIAPETLAAVAHVESSRDPLTVHVNGPDGGARHYASVDAAVADARALIASGRSIDLGIMQINSRNLGWLGLDIAAAFDACRSIAAGAHVLAAESAYNTGSPVRGISNGYAGKVQRAEMRIVGGIPEPASPATAPPPAQPDVDVWARVEREERDAMAPPEPSSAPPTVQPAAPPEARPAVLQSLEITSNDQE